MDKVVNKEEILAISTVADFRKVCCKYGGKILSDVLKINRKILMRINNLDCDSNFNINNIINSDNKSNEYIDNLINK